MFGAAQGLLGSHPDAADVFVAIDALHRQFDVRQGRAIEVLFLSGVSQNIGGVPGSGEDTPPFAALASSLPG